MVIHEADKHDPLLHLQHGRQVPPMTGTRPAFRAAHPSPAKALAKKVHFHILDRV